MWTNVFNQDVHDVLDIGCHVHKKEKADDEGGNNTNWEHNCKEKMYSCD